METSRTLEIVIAIENACKIIIAEGEVGRVVPEQRDDITIDGYWYLPDDAIVIPASQEAPTLRPTQVVLNDPMELYEAILYFHHIKNGVEIDEAQKVAYETTMHEIDHCEALTIVGFKNIKFTFAPTNLSPGLEDKFDWIATTLPQQPSRDVTKLGYASVLVAPTEPSGSDVSQALSLGYGSVTEIAERIIVQNARNPLDRLLVPKSYGIGPVSNTGPSSRGLG